MLTIRQPVAVKIVMTETTKQQIIAEYRRQIEQLTMELDQIEQQGRQAIEQAMAQGGEIAQRVREQVEEERNKRIQQREELIQQIQQIQQMPLGTEVQNMTVETTIDVHVGDDWSEILRGAEIIVKDGIVQEIRQRGTTLSD
ncbi:YlqD family protein [Alicyclobacillus herbarius]|uniref:YlqD family protein n=1 Tax=Alicyclobacillus herbarius TaxID=122960 RepID=UPI000415D3EA|nr:YlqD family protein [Alicyclobacillus herbarius]